MDVQIMVESLPMLGICNLCLKEDAVKSMLSSQLNNGDVVVFSDMLKKCFNIDIVLLEIGDSKRLICNECILKLREAADFREQVETSLRVLIDSLKNEGLENAHESVKAEDDTNVDDDDHVFDDGVGDGNGLENTYETLKSEDDEFNDDDVFDDEKIGDENAFSLDDELVKSEENAATVSGSEDLFDDDDDLALTKLKVRDRTIRNTKQMRKTQKTFPKSKRINLNTDSDPKEKLLLKKPRKLSSKKIAMKKVLLAETEAMLNAGLFPFKMRKNRIFACPICPEKSEDLDEIKLHIQDHKKSNILVAFKKMMFSNMQRFYKCAAKLRCKLCAEDISDYEELKQHTENCSQTKNRRWKNLPFKLEKDQLDCPVCSKTFLNYVSLNNHMNVHYPNFICENCGKAFASIARLRGHIRTHEVGEFPCRHCDAVFDRVTKRENHVSKEHKSGVRYACKRCNISLPSFYARQKHLAEIHNEELKRYKCKLCPQSYITPGHLSSHVRRDHLNERNHKCDKCDLAFYTKNALKMHLIKHDGERIHTCQICQKSYQRKKTLREHMRIHNNDKRFICPVCGRAFTQKCTLKGHLKVHDKKSEDDRVGQPLHSI